MKRSPLIDFMMTPQAAPETRALRRLRYLWMAACLLLAAGCGGIGFWARLLGPWIPAAIAALALATPLLGWFYFSAKSRADNAYRTMGNEP